MFQEFIYTIGTNFEVGVREKLKTSHDKQHTTPSIDPESLATFKIAVAENEQESRDALILPYERYLIEFRMKLHWTFINFTHNSKQTIFILHN